MALYLYYAADQMYEGLHGMETFGMVFSTSNPEDAIEMAKEASLDIIQSYNEIMDSLQGIAFENVDLLNYTTDGEPVPDSEYEEALKKVIEEDAYYKVWRINDIATQNMTYEELENKVAEDLESFVEEFCDKEII